MTTGSDDRAVNPPDERKAPGGQYGPQTMTQERLDALAAGRAKAAGHDARIREARERGEISRYQQYLAGELKIDDMDNDELSKGCFRDLAGGWKNNRIQGFSQKARSDMKRLLLTRGQEMLDGAYQDAIKVLVGIAKSDAAEDKDRIKAVSMIMERVAGKVPDRVEVGGADAFSDVLAGIVDDAVVEGEVVSESEPDYAE